MDINEKLAVVAAQEELLTFESFTHEDAWELGKIIVSEAMDKDLHIAIGIRKVSGLVLFQYSAEGATLNNDRWLDRKFNTVKMHENSSLHFAMQLQKQGKTLADKGLDPTQYVSCGGGFPIIVQGVGIVAVAMVSGLTDLQDHEVLVTCLSKYLAIEDVPRIPLF
ncbi:heme-degrading domain-containing protein [uncultured Sphaerochaeta sp.]|uniref:heme-degrading domain-containing protein n=1 Tax=uncultured Sphaerochaeta sp. TaxID=886478 RepID=UPI002A0A7E2D|nr:heme-degrading domain-containing protein [uncultured Sphaerochaeta sp.]